MSLQEDQNEEYVKELLGKTNPALECVLASMNLSDSPLATHNLKFDRELLLEEVTVQKQKIQNCLLSITRAKQRIEQTERIIDEYSKAIKKLDS
jgi:hypothetical protein